MRGAAPRGAPGPGEADAEPLYKCSGCWHSKRRGAWRSRATLLRATVPRSRSPPALPRAAVPAPQAHESNIEVGMVDAPQRIAPVCILPHRDARPSALRCSFHGDCPTCATNERPQKAPREPPERPHRDSGEALESPRGAPDKPREARGGPREAPMRPGEFSQKAPKEAPREPLESPQRASREAPEMRRLDALPEGTSTSHTHTCALCAERVCERRHQRSMAATGDIHEFPQCMREF